MRRKSPQLETWEVAIVRKMLETGNFSKQQILAYFSRPDRSINQARIKEIEDGHSRYEGIEPASREKLEVFLRDWGDAPSPIHPQRLARLFPRRAGDVPKLNVSETSFVEGKESFNWGSRGEYCRTLAGFANNNGGYLLFGVADGTFEVKGIADGRMDKFDLRKANEFITRTFNQALELEKGQFEVDGMTVGVIFAHPSPAKPVMCTFDISELKSGDIYYRYPGETRRVQAPELERILKERDASSESRALHLVAKLADTGTNNAAIINLATGEVQGEKGQFVIEESLLEKVKFVAQGKFVEKDGEPALRVVGDVQPLSSGKVTIQQSVVGSITERHIHEAFLYQRCRYEPAAYIQAQTNMQPLWLPIFYFAAEAELDSLELQRLLGESDSHYENRKAKQVERVQSGRAPSGAPATLTVKDDVEKLLGNDVIDVQDEDAAKRLLQAIRLLDPDAVDLDRVLSILIDLRARFGNTKALLPEFRYAITTVDLKWFRPLVVG